MTLSLLIALSTFAVAPILAFGVSRLRVGEDLLDGFVVTVILGLVVFIMLPHASSDVGLLSLVVAVLGYLFVSRAEHFLGDVHIPGMHGLAWLGLAAHAALDGAGLRIGVDISGQHTQQGALEWAIILHRIPVGIALWHGLPKRMATMVLLALGASTVLGFGFAEQTTTLMSPWALAYFEAFLGGALLHVALGHQEHHHDHGHGHAHASHHHSTAEPARISLGRWGSLRPSGIGSLVGCVVVMSLLLEDGHGTTAPWLESLERMALQSAPPLLLGFLAAAVFLGFLKPSYLNWFRRGPSILQALRGTTLGLPLPLCSCSVLPAYQALVTGGVSVAASVAFLIATPELGLDAFFLSFELLGTNFAIARLGTAFVVAVLTALLMAYLFRNARFEIPAALGEGLFDRGMKASLVHVAGPLFAHIMPWVIVGLVLAAILDASLAPEFFEALPAGTDVLVLALLGMPAYVCASGATPLAAVLLQKGISAGAVMAFLITGPASNITTFGVLKKLFNTRFALAFAVSVSAFSVAAGYVLNALSVTWGTNASLLRVDSQGSFWECAALWLLLLALGLHILDKGPRALIQELEL